MSLRGRSLPGPNHETDASHRWSELLSYPTNAPLTHMNRLMDRMALECETGVNPGKRPASGATQRDSGSETEDDNDPFVQMRREARKQRREAEDKMVKDALDKNRERSRIVNKYYREGRRSITDAERQWFNDNTFNETLEGAVSEAVLESYRNKVRGAMQRLPPGNDPKLVPLENWQMAKMSRTILETAGQMCDAIVNEFESRNLDPIADAVIKTASLKVNLTFDLQSALPVAMAVPRYSIANITVQIFARTTPSEAREQVRIRSKDKYSAITWSVLFNPGNVGDDRIRVYVNQGLMDRAKRRDAVIDKDGQIPILTPNALHAALDELWVNLIEEAYTGYVHEWRFPIPALPAVIFDDAKPRARPAAPVPAPAPPPMLPGGWMKKKRLQKK